MAARSSPSSNNKKWQEEEEKELWKMHKEEVSIGDISAALKRTSGAIKSRLAMLSVRGCPVAGCTKLFNNERGRKVHCANTKDGAHTSARQQIKPKCTDPSAARPSTESKDQRSKAVIDSRPDPVDTVKVSSVEEDEKMQSEHPKSAKSQTQCVDPTDFPSGWSPMVFTQMDVNVAKPGTTVLVRDQSWSSGAHKVDFQYPNGRGTVYSGWKWKFTEKGQPTGEDALRAMVLQNQNLQREIGGLKGRLKEQEEELHDLRQMRESQMEWFQKGMENLKISTDNE